MTAALCCAPICCAVLNSAATGHVLTLDKSEVSLDVARVTDSTYHLRNAVPDPDTLPGNYLLCGDTGYEIEDATEVSITVRDYPATECDTVTLLKSRRKAAISHQLSAVGLNQKQKAKTQPVDISVVMWQKRTERRPLPPAPSPGGKGGENQETQSGSQFPLPPGKGDRG